MVEDDAFSHKIDSHPIFLENINFEKHLICFIGSKFTAILVKGGGFYLGVELHWKGSVPAACVAGFFLDNKRKIQFKLFGIKFDSQAWLVSNVLLTFCTLVCLSELYWSKGWISGVVWSKIELIAVQ